MKISFNYFFIFSLFIQGVLFSQTAGVGISAGSLTITPSFSVINTGITTVNGSFKNKGTLTLTGTVTVNMAINTSTTSTPNYVFRTSSSYSVTTFALLATAPLL